MVQQNDVMVHGTNNSLILLSDKRGMNLDLILTKRIAFLPFPLAFSQSYFMEQRLDYSYGPTRKYSRVVRPGDCVLYLTVLHFCQRPTRPMAWVCFVYLGLVLL